MNILEKILEEKELAAIKDLIEENEKCLNKCEGVCSSIKMACAIVMTVYWHKQFVKCRIIWTM